MMKILIVIVFCVVLTLASCYLCPPSVLVRPCKCTDEDGLTLQCWNLTSKATLEGISRRTGKIQFKKLYVFQSTLPLPTKFLLQKQIQSLDLVESNFTRNFLNVNHHHRISKKSHSSSDSLFHHPIPDSLIYHSLLNSLANYSLPQTRVHESLPNSIVDKFLPHTTVHHFPSNFHSGSHQSLSNSTIQHFLPNSTDRISLPNSKVQHSPKNPRTRHSLAEEKVQHSLKKPKIRHSLANSTAEHSSKKPRTLHHSLAKKRVHQSKNRIHHSLAIEAVHIYDTTFTDSISWRQFFELRRLRFLLAYKVDIRHMEYSFRLYVSKTLERLHFWKTGTVYLEEEVFVGFTELIDVRIQECLLTELKRSYFPRPAKIQIMFFDGNQIQSLPDDIFEQMPDLRSVDLSKNHLSAVSETVFGSVYNHLGDLSLSGNPISCNCNISWIVPLQGHRYLDGYCTEPESLKERSLVTLRNGDFEFCKENITET